MMKIFALSYLLAVTGAAPAAEAEAKAEAEAEADPHYFATGYHNTIPAPNCKTDHEVLTTQACTPSTEEVCTTKTVETEEIEYEKICKDVVETLCDQPAYGYHEISKREAEAEADADPAIIASSTFADQAIPAIPAAHVASPYVPAPVAAAPAAYGHVAAAPAAYGHVAAAPVVAPAVIHPPAVAAPVAHAVAHSVTSKVKHACREVTTEHCVNSPKVKLVPVEVENCHVVTKVKCADVDNKIPKTTCEPVETVHLKHASYNVPHHIAPHHVAPHHVAHKAYGKQGY
jgi:hypothetical protein